MSQVLTTPWLSGLFETDLALGVDSYKMGQRVQMFHFARQQQPAAAAERRARGRESCAVTCEISDKHNFMRAAIMPRAVQSFENAREQPIEGMGGMVVAIRGFRIMLYDGDGPALPDPLPARKKPVPQPVACPQRIRDAGHPQFWMLITCFTYMGAEGNAVFDEPRYILTEPCVRARMEAELAARRRTRPEPEKRKAIEAASSPTPTPVPKRARPAAEASSSSPHLSPSLAPTQVVRELFGSPPHSTMPSSGASGGAQCPTIAHVPFVADAAAAWECPALWQALSIQRAAVPHMPVLGARHPPAAAARSSTAAAPAPAPRENARAREPATLHGLLVPGDAGLVSSEAMMDAMFGMIACTPDRAAEYDPRQPASDGIDAARLLAGDIA